MHQLALMDKPTIKYVAERDIDLLLLEEFNANAEFASWFMSVAFPKEKESECIGAWHSVNDPELGESDLIVLYDRGLAILIENKIDAPVQPRQGHRYTERGEKGVEEGMWKKFKTCIIAPKSYLGSEKDSRTYDSSVSYEAIDESFCQKATPDQRASHKSYLIRQAIEQNRRGYTPETDEAVTKFWNEYWELCTKQYPELEMRQPGNKPAGSDWPTFRPIKLIRHLPKSRIIHKLAEGFIDLELPESYELSEETVETLSAADATVERTGKSKSIRLRSHPVNRVDLFETQEEKVSKCLKSATRLLQLSRHLTD